MSAFAVRIISSVPPASFPLPFTAEHHINSNEADKKKIWLVLFMMLRVMNVLRDGKNIYFIHRNWYLESFLLFLQTI